MIPTATLFPPGFEGRIAAMREFAAREGTFAKPDTPLNPRLEAKLRQKGIEGLYEHQARAFDAVMAERDVMIVTGTSSGKTLCYALPALQRCLEEPNAKALLLYPTKALAQDQLSKLTALAPGGDVRIGVYDGDTPVSQRAAIRRAAHMVLTNPDMLHVGILPGHEHWAKFFRSLRLIVLDEAHAYRGVFGSHVANVLRRLSRFCEWHGSRPTIVACSATIANPLELYGKLTGRKPMLIERDAAPRSERTFLFYNPPLDELGGRESSNYASAGLMVGLAESGMRVMTFCRARSTAELVLRYARQRADAGGIVEPHRIESYRAGYTPEERRKIERALFEGELVGLVTTSAMELGVDVGGLDAVILNGYPGSVTSFWQQSGRAGRGPAPGIVVLVGRDDPLDQFFMREPSFLLDSVHEPACLNPENRTILEQQLRCAAYERPISASELGAFGESALGVAESLDRAGELEFRAERFFFPSFESPAPKVNIRGGESENFTLMLEGKALGTMERWRALQFAHGGAVYLQRGASYLVQELDTEARTITVVEASVPYYTQSVVQATTEPILNLRDGEWGAFRARLCGLRVTEHVVGYRMKSLDGDTVLGYNELDLPPITFETVGVRLDLSPLEPERAAEGVAGVHGLEHALIAVAPFLAACDRGDLGSAWYGMFPDALDARLASSCDSGSSGARIEATAHSPWRQPGLAEGGRPALFVFDRVPGGVGLSETLYQARVPWAHAALRLLETCPCVVGCPACLLSSRCEANNEALDKSEAARFLAALTAS